MNKKTSYFWTLSLFAVLFLAVSFSSCATLSVLGQAMEGDSDSTIAAIGSSLSAIGHASEDITPENQYYIGRSVGAAITSKYKVCRNMPKTTEYLNSICKAITINSETPYLYKDYCVAILDTDEINAMATPGGHIFVSRGLIKHTNSEDSLAAVIAHEIGHIQLKHSVEAIKSSRVTTAVAKSSKAAVFVTADSIASNYKSEMDYIGLDYEVLKGNADELWSAQEAIVSTLISSGFSQSQEFDADKKALSLMANAGYEPSAMIDMLELIAKDEGSNAGGWNQTHPTAAKRIKNVKSNLKKIKFTGSNHSVRQERFLEYTSELK